MDRDRDRDETVRELAARARIGDLRYAYAHHLDSGDWEAWGRLFAEDARFTVYRPVASGTTEPYEVEGREAITEFGASAIEDAFEYSAHLMHNPFVRVDGGTATGRWYFSVFSAKPNGHVNWHQGIYEDEYSREDGEWRFEDVLVTVRAESRDVHGYELEYVDGDRGEFPSVRFPV
jgi:3-phenylpropionate/cinnamic acid dioxygenase small subunit